MLRVVLVDDDPLTVIGLKAYIEWHEFGFEVVGEALDGITGMEVCRDKRPDLVMVDVRMPGISGLELIEAVQDDLPETRFVVLSAYSEFEFAQRAIRAGVADYLVKPIEKIPFEELLKAVAAQKADHLITRAESDASIPVVRRIISYIGDNLHRDFSLTDVAEEVDHCVSYISSVFHREVGVTFLTYVTRARLRRAKEILIETDHLVGTVATHVGFRSQRYFSQVFRRHEGCTPTEFRLKHQ